MTSAMPAGLLSSVALIRTLCVFVCVCVAEKEAGVRGQSGEDAAGLGAAAGSLREERTT